MESVIVKGGRQVIATALQAGPWLFALGRGDGAWASPPAADYAANGVQDLIGFVRPNIIGFAVQDEGGLFSAPDGTRYAHTSEPTDYFLAHLIVEQGSYQDEVVREVALYYQPAIDESVPAGQIAIASGQVTDPGVLFQLTNIVPITLSAGVELQMPSRIIP